MHKCCDCLKTFEEPRRVMEDRGECHGSPSYQPNEVCSFCGGDCYPVEQCVVCGEWFAELEYGHCNTCAADLEKHVTEELGSIIYHYPQPAQEYLKEALRGCFLQEAI